MTDLLGMVEALHVILAEEGAVGGLAAATHALAEVHPEVVAPALVPVDAPPRSHRLLPLAAASCTITLCLALGLAARSSFSLRSGRIGLAWFPIPVGCQ